MAGLVLVGRYLDPAEAQMAKGMLESEGIECFLVGANANAMVPLAFRVRLQVMARDEEAARRLLEEAELKLTELDSNELAFKKGLGDE